MIETWAFEQAQKVLERVQRKGKDLAVFECGFGPSGLPHIGTVAEMIRTRMVIQAFDELVHNDGLQISSVLILVADDLDALRKVPDTIPSNKVDLMTTYIGTCVCKIPDPWGTDKSYAEHNISELIRLLEMVNIPRRDYELVRSSENYRLGTYNNMLTKLAERVEEITKIITHDYSEERKESYFPFLPIILGKVIQDIYEPVMVGTPAIPSFEWFSEADYDGPRTVYETMLLYGRVKCQWKLDWPMRWMHFDVDFEMHGKDLIGSANVGRRICEFMGQEPPVIFMYELFLDENKEKISKSKGNGLEITEWLTYGSVESLQFYLWQNPVKGRVLHWSCIPQYEDMYAKALSDSNGEVGSALWHIHGSNLPEAPPITYNLLLNLVSIANTESTEVLWNYLRAYKPELSPESHPSLQHMMIGAIRYYQRFILLAKFYRNPTDEECLVLDDIANLLKNALEDDSIDLRAELYNIGKDYYSKERLREYFSMLYQVLMGQDSGPQFDQFVRLVGLQKVINLIHNVL